MPQNRGNVSRDDTLVEQINRALQEGGNFTLTVTGTSMEPFLRHRRSHVQLRRPGAIRRWQIIFYRRDNGQYILHRAVRLRGSRITVCGDAQQQLETIRREQVIATVEWLSEDGENWVQWGSLWHRLRSSLWHFLRPVRPILLRLMRK